MDLAMVPGIPATMAEATPETPAAAMAAVAREIQIRAIQETVPDLSEMETAVLQIPGQVTAAREAVLLL